jgi:hypothetical protein
MDRKLMVVDVAPNRVPPFGEPKALFEFPFRTFAIAPTGDLQRTLVPMPVAENATAPITVVVNWRASLKQ